MEDILTRLPNPHTLPIAQAAGRSVQHQEPPVALRTPYPYTADLLSLDRGIPCHRQETPWWLSQIVTPLSWRVWEQALGGHPDTMFCEYIARGIREGFRMGFDYSHRCVPATKNMPSAKAHPQPVQAYIDKECQAGRILGPLPREAMQNVQVSRFGVIPKSTLGKWRLILDLSFPEGGSVNDGILRDHCHLQLASVDDAARIIADTGQGTLLGKVDIEQAYRNVPVHPGDRWLLGMEWKGQGFIDTALPFGLRSAPKIFCALSDALQWILQEKGVRHSVKYIDDFLVFGAPGTGECARNLRCMETVCKDLGLPLAAHKREGPTEVVTFLGIELDTQKMVMRLPDDKREALREKVEKWCKRKACKKRQLLSLIGHLAHACKVVPAGRMFLRRMINLAAARPYLGSWIRLGKEYRSDIQWWRLLLDLWNGVTCSLLSLHLAHITPDVTIFTDASGSWGCGGHWEDKWFQCQWTKDWEGEGISVKEMLPVVLACALWGSQWTQRCVLVKTDNESVVHIVRSRTCKEPRTLHLLRCLQFFLAAFQIHLRIEHVAGVSNITADALSRNLLQVFQGQRPTAERNCTPISATAVRMLISGQPDWLSPDWRAMLLSICMPGLPQAPPGRMAAHRTDSGSFANGST